MIANPTIQGGGGKTYVLTVAGKQFDFTAGMTWADVAKDYPESFVVYQDQILYNQRAISYPGSGSLVNPSDLASNLAYVAQHSGGSN
jgi:hypothetical protein